MKRLNYKHIYQRTRQFLIKPEVLWPQVLKEDFSIHLLFQSYLLPIAITTSLFVFLLSLFSYSILSSIGLFIINLISSLCGIWFAYLITKEYLCTKLSYHDHQALNLTVYSGAIFIFFHGIGSALGNIFLGQLFTLLSFIFIRTLYTGLGQLPALQNGQKTNILIITSLSIICIPIIISQILTIVFRIPVINI